MGFFSNEKLKSIRGCAGCSRCSHGERELSIIGDDADVVFVMEHLSDDRYTNERISYLTQQLNMLGIKDDEYTLLGAVCDSKKSPEEKEITYCLKNVLNEIDKIKPTVVIPLGNIIIKTFAEHFWKDKAGIIERWINHTIPINGQFWLCPMDDPGYLHTCDYAPLNKRFINGIIKAFETPETVPYYKDRLASKIEILSDIGSMVEAIKEFAGDDLVAFDYETTGLKPQAEGHDIYSVSLASDRRCTSFLLPDDARVRKALKKFLVSDVKKIAQNFFFEDIWSSVILGTEVKNWVWDTMLVEHIQNNTKQSSGLKFQSFVYLGIENYNSEIERYLKGEGGNGFNKVHEAPVQPLLLYGGYDAILTLELYKRQKRLHDESLRLNLKWGKNTFKDDTKRDSSRC